MISLRKNIITLFMALAVVAVSFAQTPESWKALEKPLNFYLANDLGRNGYYDQKPIAELMGNMAENVDIECVIAAGDVHHFEGVRSVNDPLWMTNYELIYSHPELMIPWYAILGNHEYRGNTQAVIDYSAVSARWNVPDRYYTFAMENDGVTVRFVMDMNKQLAWIDSVLTAAKEDWVLVVGHHPIYAETGKDDSERLDLQKRLDSVLRKHKNVDMYLCGHIHNFQHIRKADSNIDYVVNTSGSLSRKVKPVDGTKFCSGETGFSLISADKKELNLHMINKEGKVIYTVSRKK